MEDQLLLLLDLELLDQLEGSRLVVAHVLVPRLRELLELQLLGRLNIHKLLLLGQPHILFLALLLSPAELLEAQLHHLGSRVVTASLCVDAQLIHDSMRKETWRRG